MSHQTLALAPAPVPPLPEEYRILDEPADLSGDLVERAGTATPEVTQQTRLLQPMQRPQRGQAPQPVAWNQALDTVATPLAGPTHQSAARSTSAAVPVRTSVSGWLWRTASPLIAPLRQRRLASIVRLAQLRIAVNSFCAANSFSIQ